MTIFPRKVRHVSPIRDVWIRLAAKYLHIDIFDQNLKKVWILCVLLLYSALGEEAGDSGVSGSGCIGGRQKSRVEDYIRTATSP